MLRRAIGNSLFFRNSRVIYALSTAAPPFQQCDQGCGIKLVNSVNPPLGVKNSSAFYFVKAYCSSASKDDPNIATYEEVKNIKSHPEKLLIDVREPEELKETGQIPYSINIPLQELESALTDETSGKKFEKKYGRGFPSRDSPLIFTCRSGVRVQKGVEIAHKLGFSNVKNYKGSWLDWAEREGLSK